MFPQDKQVIFFIAGTAFVLLLVLFILLYIYLHQQKVNKYQLLLREQELRKQQELFLALQEGEEKERKRLAEELHDGIGAKLSGLKMSLEYLQLNIPGKEQALLEKLRVGMNESIEELREISQNLQPAFIETKGLKNALLELAENLGNRNSCSYTCYIELEEEKLQAKFRLLLFRIASELLNNIHKHAQASEASLQLLQTGNSIQLIAEDNGHGFSNSGPQGIGLLNLRNRVALYQGSLNIDSGAHGSTVIIELNMEKEHE